MELNPLLDFSGLPRFGAVRPEHVSPAIAQLLAENRALLVQLAAPERPATWEALVEPLDGGHERLARAWGIVAHLHAVRDAPALREAYNANLPAVVRYWTELGQNQALYLKFQALRESPGFAALDSVQRKIIEDELRDFRLEGAGLPEPAKRQLAAIQEELAALEAKFSENLLDATDGFSLAIDEPEELAGVPRDVLEAAAQEARRAGRRGWILNLRAPCYLAVMQHAERRELRETLYRAFATRASEFGPASLDNTPLIARILRLRRDKARLLGYASFAELSLVPKMARSPAQVLEFLSELAERALPFARRDFAELSQFAAHELGIRELQAWDIAFASEKLRAHRYRFTDEEVRQYFPEPRVLEGLFRAAGRLYGVRFVETAGDVWHPEVRIFRLEEEEDGAPLGHLYIDLHAREGKRGGAWMDEAIARRRANGREQLPAAYLVCNFAPPSADRPALLAHEDVLTLFHELGHALHHLLSRVDYLGASGMHGVEWDAIELPSQFMENFGWEWEVLAPMSWRVDSGEPLPRALYQRMRAAKNFQSGMQMVRQIELALFDMHLHHDYDPGGAKSPLELLAEIRARVAVVRPPDYERFPNSFAHIFAGGYAAGYYGYKWAEVLSADAYGAFEERRDSGGILDRESGARFRAEILAVGGSRPTLESFKAFRGREPRAEALLRQNGMMPAV